MLWNKTEDVAALNQNECAPMPLSQIEVSDNRIYFYCPVSTETVRQLVLALRRTNLDLAQKQLQLGLANPIPIYLHIHSGGGDLFAGLSAVDEIANSRSPVTSIVTGEAASAATLMSVAAAHRVIHPHAYMLIHQLSWGLWGKAQEMEDGYQNVKTFMKMIKQIYRQYTKVPMKKIDEILKHDLWWPAEECLKYSLVDEIGVP